MIWSDKRPKWQRNIEVRRVVRDALRRVGEPPVFTRGRIGDMFHLFFPPGISRADEPKITRDERGIHYAWPT